MNILFVCSANISRSFLAEMLFNHEAGAKEMADFRAASAGLFALSGHSPDPKMVEYLSKKGIPTRRHEASQLTAKGVEWADLILVMENEHKRLIEAFWPEAKGKVDLLGKFSSEGQGAADVVDAYGRSSYHYRLTQSQISLAVTSLVKHLLESRSKVLNAQDQVYNR